MRILLVDDHKMMRDGLRALLEKHPGMEVAGEASSGFEALEMARKLTPDLIVMDVTMPDLNGIEATRKIMAELPRTKVVALSMNTDRRYITAMLEAGAVGYLIKNAASDELIQAVNTISRNHTYLSPAIAGVVVDSYVRRVYPAESASGAQLTPRERQVLQLLAEGKTSREMAVQLELAVPTVETHRRQIMRKLDIHSVAELTKYALREGLTSLEI